MLKAAAITLSLGLGVASMVSFFKRKAGDQHTGVLSKHLEGIDADKVDWKAKDNAFWKKNLAPMVYRVTRQGGTERPFTGKYVQWTRQGTFSCAGCGQRLFSSKTKYKSGTGWPSFWDVLDSAHIIRKEDRSFGIVRTEVLCSRCHAHLGHVFSDGPPPTGLRYCINSVALNFVDQ